MIRQALAAVQLRRYHLHPLFHSVLPVCSTMSEKLCLQWNDFKENATSAFGTLRESNDFADVTLACEDGKRFEAHKVILANSQTHKHPHPLIYLRGIKSEDLVAMMDFLYCGETNVDQKNRFSLNTDSKDSL